MTETQADTCQQWRGMDGVTAFYLIGRHAADWEGVAMMMSAWRRANEAPAMLEESGWLPIETAPKDGAEILVYTRSECFYVVAYDDIFSAPWRVRNDEGLNEAVPTHWMPLPKPPASEVERHVMHHG